jgi:hypothetical protein
MTWQLESADRSAQLAVNSRIQKRGLSIDANLLPRMRNTYSASVITIVLRSCASTSSVVWIRFQSDRVSSAPRDETC